MKNLKNKLNKKGGFTLIEMLIVVAIIAILIAVSIPLVTSALDKAKEATDTANERSAVALAEVKFLSEDITWTGTGDARTAVFAYQVSGSAGSLVEVPTTAGDDFKYGQCKDHEDGYIKVTLKIDGSVTCDWSTATSKPHYAKPTTTT